MSIQEWSPVGHIPFGDMIRAKEARLTHEAARGELFYCPTTGGFRRAKGMNRVLGAEKDGYRRIKVIGTWFPAHRLAWFIVNGSWPVGVIDHINGDRGDNRLCNLRDVSPRENRHNRRGRAGKA